MANTPLSVLNLPQEARSRLENIYIKSVEHFVSRVSTPEAIEELRVEMGISPVLMESLVKRARSFVKPVDKEPT